MPSEDLKVAGVITTPQGLVAAFHPTDSKPWEDNRYFFDKNSSGKLDLGDELIKDFYTPSTRIGRVVTKDEVERYSEVVNPLWRFYREERTNLEHGQLSPQDRGDCIIILETSEVRTLSDVMFDPPLQIVLAATEKVYSARDIDILRTRGSVNPKMCHIAQTVIPPGQSGITTIPKRSGTLFALDHRHPKQGLIPFYLYYKRPDGIFISHMEIRPPSS